MSTMNATSTSFIAILLATIATVATAQAISGERHVALGGCSQIKNSFSCCHSYEGGENCVPGNFINGNTCEVEAEVIKTGQCGRIAPCSERVNMGSKPCLEKAVAAGIPVAVTGVFSGVHVGVQGAGEAETAAFKYNGGGEIQWVFCFFDGGHYKLTGITLAQAYATAAPHTDAANDRYVTMASIPRLNEAIVNQMWDGEYSGRATNVAGEKFAGLGYQVTDVKVVVDMSEVSKAWSTRTTITTTDTTTTTTNTIAAAIGRLPDLTEIEALIESQIGALKSGAAAMEARLSAIEQENVALKQQLADQAEAQLAAVAEVAEAVKLARSLPPSVKDALQALQSQRPSGGGAGTSTEPAIGTEGDSNSDLALSALGGRVVIDAATCGGPTDLCLLSVAVQAMLDTFE